MSFDCAKATNKTEKAICSDNFLSYLDDTLDGVYKNALENTQNKNELIVEERAWLTKLRATCNEDNFCISTMYRGRINSLNEFIREANTQKKTQNDVKSDVKSDVKTPVKSDAKAAVNTAAKTDVKSDGENLAHEKMKTEAAEREKLRQELERRLEQQRKLDEQRERKREQMMHDMYMGRDRER